MLKMMKGFYLLLLAIETASAALTCSLTDPVTVDPDGELEVQKLFNEEERTLTLKVNVSGG